MLDRNPQQSVAEAIDALSCYVRLPEDWEEGAEHSGPSRAFDDQRRHPRFACRGSHGRAALEYRQTLPGLPRKPGWYRVPTMDLSRSGLRFLHSEPLFPRERMRLMLPDGKFRVIEVKWCVRIGELCYSVGSIFVEARDLPQSSPTLAAGLRR